MKKYPWTTSIKPYQWLNLAVFILGKIAGLLTMILIVAGTRGYDTYELAGASLVTAGALITLAAGMAITYWIDRENKGDWTEE